MWDVLCRYDVALAINTLGVKHVSCFANECTNMKLLIHVSTGWYAKVTITRYSSYLKDHVTNVTKSNFYMFNILLYFQ